jgi:hypothetical protein
MKLCLPSIAWEIERFKTYERFCKSESTTGAIQHVGAFLSTKSGIFKIGFIEDILGSFFNKSGRVGFPDHKDEP